MEFFGVEAFIFTKFFRGRPIFFRDIPNSSEVNPYLMAVFRGECNFGQSSGVSPQLGWGGGRGTDIKCDSPLLLTWPPCFIRIQFKTFILVCIISSFYKAFVQFSSRSIEQILKQFLNYQAEENPCRIFFLELLISSSSIPLSLFNTQIMNCLARHKNLSLF